MTCCYVVLSFSYIDHAKKWEPQAAQAQDVTLILRNKLFIDFVWEIYLRLIYAKINRLYFNEEINFTYLDIGFSLSFMQFGSRLCPF